MCEEVEVLMDLIWLDEIHVSKIVSREKWFDTIKASKTRDLNGRKATGFDGVEDLFDCNQTHEVFDIIRL